LGIGDSMNLKKGEKTVAIGSPTGFTNTVSTGIFGNYLDIGNYFQILSSASLSPGSSGGALFNDRGEVIGITSGAYTDGNDLYYSIKLDASKLLLDNVDKTFVTPVFNGSASLRDAAGQMIENTAKAVRRHQTVDGAFIEKLYGDMTSLYRLDQHASTGAGKTELGPLPDTAVMLLTVLGITWLLIGVYVLNEFRKEKKKKAGTH